MELAAGAGDAAEPMRNGSAALLLRAAAHMADDVGADFATIYRGTGRAESDKYWLGMACLFLWLMVVLFATKPYWCGQTDEEDGGGTGGSESTRRETSETAAKGAHGHAATIVHQQQQCKRLSARQAATVHGGDQHVCHNQYDKTDAAGLATPTFVRQPHRVVKARFDAGGFVLHETSL